MVSVGPRRAGAHDFRRKGHSDLKKKDDDTKSQTAENRPSGPEKDPQAQTAAEAGAAEKDAADQKPGETPQTDKEATGEAKPDEKAGEKTVSETDVLKIYLQQSMAEIKRLKGELETARGEKETEETDLLGVREKYNSLAHEYENYRRRTAEEKAGIHDDAVAQVVTSLLPALDSLERAMDFSDSNAESFRKGVEMTLRQLSDGFKKLGVEEIEAQNQTFDPNIHSAVMHVEDTNLGESVVTDVLQKGYRIGERVIRHSMVKVAN